MSKNKNLFIIKSMVAPGYSMPSFESSKITEAVSGETVEILKKKNNWIYVKQDDGYESWINNFYGSKSLGVFNAEFMVVDTAQIPFGTRVAVMDKKYITVNGDEYFPKDEPVIVNEVIKP